MNFGQWISQVRAGVRPGAALVISGPQGSGKSVMTNGLLHEAGLSIYEASGKSDLAHPMWGTSDVVVFREGMDPQAAIELVCNTHWASDDGEARSVVPTPLAVIIETLEPDLYEGRRFVHIRLGDTPSKMTAREHAAMTLKVPNSGTEWLDQMVIEARRLDAEAFQAKLQEPQGSVAFPDVSNPTTHAPQGKATMSPQGPKDRPAGGAGMKVG